MRNIGRFTGWISAGCVIAVLAACGDSTAPRPVAGAGIAAVQAVPHSLITINSMSSDSTSADFTVTPTGGTFIIGPHGVYFPANAICDPATSSYGMGTWDQSCTPLNRPIQIHAEVRRLHGDEWVDFTPSLRFVPSWDQSRWVWIGMRTRDESGLRDNKLNILWTPGFDQDGVDESLNDPTLRSVSIPSAGIVARRIKHFSGYMVAG